MYNQRCCFVRSWSTEWDRKRSSHNATTLIIICTRAPFSAYIFFDGFGRFWGHLPKHSHVKILLPITIPMVGSMGKKFHIFFENFDFSTFFFLVIPSIRTYKFMQIDANWCFLIKFFFHQFLDVEIVYFVFFTNICFLFISCYL